MNRMRDLRQQMGINMREAAEKLNLPYTTYVNYEKGVREPTSEMLIAIANLYETSIDYLIGRINSDTKVTVNTSTSTIEQCSPAEQEHIKKYRTLDEYGKEAVDAILNIEHNRCNEKAEIIESSAIAARGGELAPRAPIDKEAFKRDIANLRSEDEPDL